MSGEKKTIVRALFLLIVLVSIHARFDAQAPSTRGLESFYVTFTDYRILHVRPAGSGVSVRAIQLHYLEESCWTRVMRAYDVNLPDTTVQTLANVNVCALSQRRIDDALDRSRENFIRGRDGIQWGTSLRQRRRGLQRTRAAVPLRLRWHERPQAWHRCGRAASRRPCGARVVDAG